MKKRKSDDKDRPWLVGRLNARSVPKAEVRRSRKAPESKQRPRVLTVVIVALVVLVLSWVPFTQIHCVPQSKEGDCQSINVYDQIISSSRSLFDYIAPLVNEAHIEEALAANGSVDSVDVHRTWYNALGVDIVERTPKAVWQLENDNSVRYILDRNGVVMSQVTASSGNLANLLLVRDRVALQPTVGEPLVELQVIQYADKITDEGLFPGYQITSVTVDDSPREFTAKFRATDGSAHSFNAKFSTNRLLEKQILDLAISLEYLMEQGIDYNYIDLRLESSTPYR